LVLNPSTDGVITNNTICNLTGNNAAGTTISVRGIDVQGAGGRHTITGNTVYNLTNNGATASINNAASVVGIDMSASALGSNIVAGNTDPRPFQYERDGLRPG
jgi:hypothetical protein